MKRFFTLLFLNLSLLMLNHVCRIHAVSIKEYVKDFLVVCPYQMKTIILYGYSKIRFRILIYMHVPKFDVFIVHFIILYLKMKNLNRKANIPLSNF